MDSGRVRDPIRALGEVTGAGTVVSGTAYVVDDSLEIHVNVTDAARSKPLGAIESVRGSRVSTSEVIAITRDRVMAFLAMRFDERLRDWRTGVIGQPPSFEAYQQFDEGHRLQIRRDYEQAIPHFRRASELDPTWALPLLRLRSALANSGRSAEIDTVVMLLEGLGDRLTPFEQAEVQYMRALADGDVDRALASLRRAAEFGPGSPAHYNLASRANKRNRPNEALRALSSFDPEHGWLRGWVPYWWEITEGLNKTGEHERELEAAVRAYELHPDRGAWVLRFQARALTALGRVDEIESVLDELEKAADLPRSPAAWRHIISYLRVNGYADVARTVTQRAIGLFEAKQPLEESMQYEYARLLWLSGRLEEAHQILEALVDGNSQNVAYRGLRSVIAVALGDTNQVMDDVEWLESVNRPYLFGLHTFWRGAIMGALGDTETAMALVRQAFAEGQNLSVWAFAGAELAPLRDHPDFQELMRPKG